MENDNKELEKLLKELQRIVTDLNSESNKGVFCDFDENGTCLFKMPLLIVSLPSPKAELIDNIVDASNDYENNMIEHFNEEVEEVIGCLQKFQNSYEQICQSRNIK